MKHAMKQVKLETKPNEVQGRPVKADTARVVAKLEVDRGDYALVYLTMPVAELLERAERIDQPDIPAVIEARLKREVTRRPE